MLVQKSFSSSATLNASPEIIWDIISKASGVNEWLPIIATCSYENGKRFCTTAEGHELKESIDRVDHENHVFYYSIYEQNMLPVENYKGTFSVNATQDGNTAITWSADFDIMEENYEAVAQGLQGVYQLGFDGLEKLAKQKAMA